MRPLPSIVPAASGKDRPTLCAGFFCNPPAQRDRPACRFRGRRDEPRRAQGRNDETRWRSPVRPNPMGATSKLKRDRAQQPFRGVPETQSPPPLYKRECAASLQNETVRSFKPFAPVPSDAVHDVCHADDPASLELCRIKPVVNTGLPIDIEGRLNEEWPAVFGRPTAVLDVFNAPSNQVSPRLPDRQDLHNSLRSRPSDHAHNALLCGV